MALISRIDPPSSFVKITNNSEHNITWVVIVDMKTGYAVANEKGDELIAKPLFGMATVILCGKLCRIHNKKGTPFSLSNAPQTPR